MPEGITEIRSIRLRSGQGRPEEGRYPDPLRRCERHHTSLRGRLQYYEAGETVEVTVQSPEDGSYEEKTVTLTLSTKAEVEAANQ